MRLVQSILPNQTAFFAVSLFLTSLNGPALLQGEQLVLTGAAALGDWTTDSPGARRRITLRDVAPPGATKSAFNSPRVVSRPKDAWPKAPAGFKVERFAEGLREPRIIHTAPNGDIFVAESSGNRVRVLRDADGDGKPEISEVFVEGLKQPFGLAFYPPGPNPKFLYIANTDSIVRVPYRNGQVRAEAEPEQLAELSSGGRLTGGGHWTRDVIFSPDGKRMFVSIGSRSNVSDDASEERRARIFEYDPQGRNEKVAGWGLRNPVGLAIEPESGSLWTTVNERDGLGDDCPPDYVTRVKPGGFYGWPWFYLGGIPDPRHPGKHPELREKVSVPDLLLQSHSAALGITFYDGKKFPAEYRGQAFVGLHGSWNRARRTGYKVIRIPVADGRPAGEYIDFLTGFVANDGNVWGRPVGVTTAKDGALLVTDDGGNCIWRVSYVGVGN